MPINNNHENMQNFTAFKKSLSIMESALDDQPQQL